MQSVTWKGLARLWFLVLFFGTIIVPLIPGIPTEEFWSVLVTPFVAASMLGFWLTAGYGPVWLRLLAMVVGQSLLMLFIGLATGEHPMFFSPGLAATTAFTASALLGIGCIGSVVPISITWQVRIALWEIIVSVGLVGVALAIARLIASMYAWDWPTWAAREGIHFLVFALFTGLQMMFVLLPLIVRGRGMRWGAAALLVVAVALIPPVEFWTFTDLNLSTRGMSMFYAAHMGQTLLGLAVMIPLTIAFPGVLVQQTAPQSETAKQLQPQPSEEDFADLQ